MGTKEGSTSCTASDDSVLLTIDHLTQYLQHKRETSKRPSNVMRRVMRRVRTQLRELEPRHYNAELFSFGLFRISDLDAGDTLGLNCKLAFAVAFLEDMNMVAKEEMEVAWEKLCKEVMPNPNDIQELYHKHDRDRDGIPVIPLSEVQSLLTLDAVFLTGYLGVCSKAKNFKRKFPRIGSAINDSTKQTIFLPLMKDLFKVENQFPLSLIQNVLEILVQDATWRVHVFTEICRFVLESNNYLLPGYDDTLFSRASSISPIPEFIMNPCPCGANDDDDDFYGGEGTFEHDFQELFPLDRKGDESYNFLDCMRWAMCKDITQNQKSRPGSFSWLEDHVSLPTVTQLKRAGVRFQGYKGCFHDIRFKPGWLVGTLHLPILNITDVSESIWRNLVAYEDMKLMANEDDPYNQEFTHYLGFMDRIIGDPEDVMLLKSVTSPIILGNTFGTNENVACLFNNTMIRNCVWSESEKWNILHEEIHKFYNQKFRRMCLETWRTQFGKPWTSISLVAATILLLLTVVQTYYTWASYEAERYGVGTLASLVQRE